jgi:hypothetical protein
MGFTRYWHRKDVELDESLWREFIARVNKIIDESDVPLADGEGTPGTNPRVDMKEIWLNGVGPDDDHETFYIPRVLEIEDYEQEIFNRRGYYFAFCKTARKPYDAIVRKSLLVFKEIFGEQVDISSD